MAFCSTGNTRGPDSNCLWFDGNILFSLLLTCYKSALQNAGLTVINTIVGVLVDHYNYDVAVMLFLAIDVIAILVAVILFLLDVSRNSALTNVTAEKLHDSQNLGSINK
jgi:hypothetical protein